MAKRHLWYASAILPLLLIPLWFLLSSQNLQRRKAELQSQWESHSQLENMEAMASLLPIIEETRGWPLEDLELKSRELQVLSEKREIEEHFAPLFIEVPGGSFHRGNDWQGKNPEKNDEFPLHWIEMDSFFIMQREWTLKDSLELLQAFEDRWYVLDGVLRDRNSNHLILDLQDNHSAMGFSLEGLYVEDSFLDYPQNEITWYGAVFLCNLLSELHGYPPVYDLVSGNVIGEEGYSLPSEAQWEWAARGATTQELFPYSGSEDPLRVAWFYANSPNGPQAVQQLAPNALGLYDMSGNLYEWCQDWYAVDYYSYSPDQNPLGPTEGRDRVIRGGSFSDWTVPLRTGFRFFRSPSASQSYVGFRPIFRESQE